jgi:glutamine amidotransferase
LDRAADRRGAIVWRIGLSDDHTMCRLYGFKANEPTKVECPLVYAQNALLIQSWYDLRGQSHPDGWGIGYYLNAKPVVERRAIAAFQDAHFGATAERVYASIVLAHVRLATVGGSELANAHPFVRGRWLFAHNGTVRAFERVARRLAAETSPDLVRRGTTDSEAVFCWLLSRMAQAGMTPEDRCTSLPTLVSLVAESIRTLAGWCAEEGGEKPPRLNLLLTDGAVLLAVRWNNSLYWVARRGISNCEICGIPHIHHETGAQYRSVDVASEPITHETWCEMPNFSILAVDENVQVQMRPIEPPVKSSPPRS